ncbi:hypothetical protein LOK49_LG05G00293 [Camellia lanceoleosa]|uniref:Uncharacterized protein n=1 Tax=Camellia lanceoleosa TaxID=1840588 RepID=A0ACC0HL20_9ERIC|nr:hypothetical protein LOK49_LG05G00293 [Camellia lanceoleosa]
MYTKVASALVPEGRETTEVDQVNLFDDHEQNSESHVHQGGLSSGAEGREATEVDQVDLFDDQGLTVSSLVSIDCNEDRGNGPASLDKSFGEDKYVAKEKVVGSMMDNLSIDATDGSNVRENVFSEQKFSDMQLVGQDVLEEDAFVSGVGGLGLNNLYPVYDFSGVQIINSKRNYKKNVLYIVNYWFTTLTYKTISIQYLQFQKI